MFILYCVYCGCLGGMLVGVYLFVFVPVYGVFVCYLLFVVVLRLLLMFCCTGLL